MIPSSHRLSLKRDLKAVRKKGSLSHGPYFGLLVARYRPGPTQLGFIVSKKVSSKAVGRNRGRRLLKAAVLSCLPQIKPGRAVVFLAKKSLVGAKLDQIKLEVKKMLGRAGVLRS